MSYVKEILSHSFVKNIKSNMWQNVLEILVNEIKKHGLPLMMMSVAIYFFYNQFNQLRSEIDACNERIIDIYRNDHIEMKDVISKNTAAINSLNKSKLHEEK